MSTPPRAPTPHCILTQELPGWRWPFQVRFAPHVSLLPAMISALPTGAQAVLEAHDPDTLDCPAAVKWSVGSGRKAWERAATREVVGRITVRGGLTLEILNDALEQRTALSAMT
jgi:hypothetical protein